MTKILYHPPAINTPGLSINGMGLREGMDRGMVDRPGGTGDILLMIFHREFYLDTAEDAPCYPPPSVVFWPNGSGHVYGNRRKKWSHSWLHFDGHIAEKMLAREDLPTATPIPLRDTAPILATLLNLHEECRRGKEADEAIATAQLQILLRQLIRLRTDCEQANRDARPEIHLAHEYMSQHFHNQITLDTLAEIANLSVPRLSQLWQKHYDSSPIEDLISLRLRQAMYLLRDRNLTIGEIAHRVGYDDIYYFSKLVKKRFGKSPSGLRKDLLDMKKA